MNNINNINNYGDSVKMDNHNHDIKCNVTNCYYNHEHYCTASSIEVNALGDGIAHNSEGTACTTFIPK